MIGCWTTWISSLRHWSRHTPEGASLEAAWNTQFAEYEKKYGEEAAELKSIISGELPAGWEEALPVSEWLLFSILCFIEQNSTYICDHHMNTSMGMHCNEWNGFRFRHFTNLSIPVLLDFTENLVSWSLLSLPCSCVDQPLWLISAVHYYLILNVILWHLVF